jgi:hypothetical protein
LGEGHDAQDVLTVQSLRTNIVLIAMLSPALLVYAAAPTAAVQGVVRDAQGVGQLGATVQVLSGGSLAVATAVTDLYGRYRIASLVPGKYEVRATAALYMPATRANLQLRMGTMAVVNLTLNSLSSAAAWLPAEKRQQDEPNDDWKWTLRSAANRPVLRLLEDGEMVLVSSSATDAVKAMTQARAAMLSGDGGFGGGGVHDVVTVDRVLVDGADVVLRADVASARTPFGAGPATELEAGYERRVALGGAARLVVSYQGHPELVSSGGVPGAGGTQNGMQALRMSSAQTMHLGDLADIEAGGTMIAVHAGGNAMAMQPFVRVAVHPSEVWTIGYRLATSRTLQSFAALDSVEAGLPTAVMEGGRVRTESGRHQEIAVSRKLGQKFGGALLLASVYRDGIDRAAVAGTGVMGTADLVPASGVSGVVTDTVTGNFQFLGTGYTAQGVSVTFSQPLASGMWAAVQYQTGAALAARDTFAQQLGSVQAGLHSESGQSATLALKGRVLHGATKLRAAYRWQPSHLVTPVGMYNAFSDQAFLSCNLRQTLHWRDRLPPGLEATVDVTNLLAQGYQPFLSADGHTLFLAQSPRTVQAGLSFTF